MGVKRVKYYSMKTFILMLLLICLFLKKSASGDIKIYKLPQNIGTFSFSGEMLWRYEYRDWFDPTPGYDNQYGFFFKRTRLGLRFNSEKINAFVQGQYVHLFNLPENSFAPPPYGPLGLGAIYYAHNQAQGEAPYRIFLKNAYINFNDPFNIGISGRFGRFDYIDGLEVMTDSEKFNFLKKIRIGHRLISSMDWTAVSRSFDGGEISYDHRKFNLMAGITRPTQGGFEVDGEDEIEDLDLVYSSLTIKKSELIPDTELRIFYIYYDDDRNVTQRVDNTLSPSSDVDIRVHTLGFNLVGIYKLGKGEIDTLLWAAFQFGDWYNLDHEAYALSAEIGYQSKNLPLKPWIRGGYFISSGDSNAEDDRHETFYQILPSSWAYARFPFYNAMNSKDLFGMLILKPTDNLILRSDWHFLWLDESDDGLYSGSGPTQERGNIFGYLYRPSMGKQYIGNLADISATLNVSKNLNFTAYYGHAFGGDVMNKLFKGKSDADYFYIETLIQF
ncbi:MAG: hypothetical protein A2149_00905 [Candidatus Schekmanbacteria bacterium RBG_16_38_11]|uniref:Alginate export domain-containing protein n=1 Tax=Candidatus Schekmanbacteria bacterium RBG_16_38_11 TaxID=1817880 RepID=A0A1F7S1G5_9BACT|nr:MAG: hypothetical protein A2149_00905 [Candidatus Schekmanbacteria bacterium RBG_16_38_11]